MIVKATLTAYLPFDVSEMKNELEVTIANIMINHMTIDYPCGELYCVVTDNDIEDDLKKAGISWDNFDKCIAEFEKRGYLNNERGEYSFVVGDVNEDVETSGYCQTSSELEKKLCDTTSQIPKSKS
jgi:hypothetical protein